ncbi:hypothetical protein [Clostridium sp. FP1]|uniref:hypothetical protein n=1 Tax=Clostridium sp. FP1 TaxID=2724076 RepID=UPI0013E92061|nr:hypothetical protein [Clostridium sp. FP1]MBZ9635617.1 hypothetical protein [Clostridium sp. FP1]
MGQIFIKVKKNGHWINKDVTTATYQERMEFYQISRKYQIINMIEKLIKNE